MANKELEIRMLAEADGYCEEEIDDIVDIYNEVIKHVGFKDNRRDSRFIVKFHDIFYYAPEEYYDDEYYNTLFSNFCDQEYDLIIENLKDENIWKDEILAGRPCGHYETFILRIPEITEDNAFEIATDIYTNVDGYSNIQYVNNYVKAVEMLQDLEDNYMEYWFEYLDEVCDFPKKFIKQMRKKYKEDMERRKAKQTLAK